MSSPVCLHLVVVDTRQHGCTPTECHLKCHLKCHLNHGLDETKGGRTLIDSANFLSPPTLYFCCFGIEICEICEFSALPFQNIRSWRCGSSAGKRVGLEEVNFCWAGREEDGCHAPPYYGRSIGVGSSIPVAFMLSNQSLQTRAPEWGGMERSLWCQKCTKLCLLLSSPPFCPISLSFVPVY